MAGSPIGRRFIPITVYRVYRIRSTAQIDLAARGAAWGDAVGVALANDLGPLKGEGINFFLDAAQGAVQLIGVAAPVDHFVT